MDLENRLNRLIPENLTEDQEDLLLNIRKELKLFCDCYDYELLADETGPLLGSSLLLDDQLNLWMKFLLENLPEEITQEDLAGLLLESGLQKLDEGFHIRLVEQINRYLPSFNLGDIEKLLSKYEGSGQLITIELLRNTFTLSLKSRAERESELEDRPTPSWIASEYPIGENELYQSISQNIPPPSFHWKNDEEIADLLLADPQLLNIFQRDMELISSDEPSIEGQSVSNLKLIRQALLSKLSQMSQKEKAEYFKPVGILNYRNALQEDLFLFRVLGPANPSCCSVFVQEWNSGGERMFFDYSTEHDQLNPQQDDYINQDWFSNQCNHSECLNHIDYFWEAVRIPLLEGGWFGCYCSWDCAKNDAIILQEQELALKKLDGSREENKEDEPIVYLDGLNEEWDELFQTFETLLEERQIYARKPEEGAIYSISKFFRTLGNEKLFGSIHLVPDVSIDPTGRLHVESTELDLDQLDQLNLMTDEVGHRFDPNN